MWRPRGIGVAAILITVTGVVGLRGTVRHSTAESDDSGRAFLTTAAWAGRPSSDTDTTQRARKSDSARRATRRKGDTLSQDSLAKRRDAAARARHKPSDSIKAHSAPPEGAVVP
jgi:hypothetical protein